MVKRWLIKGEDMLQTPDGILLPKAEVTGWTIWGWSGRLPSVVEFFISIPGVKLTVSRESFDDLEEWIEFLHKWGLPDEEICGPEPRSNGNSPMLTDMIEEALREDGE